MSTTAEKFSVGVTRHHNGVIFTITPRDLGGGRVTVRAELLIKTWASPRTWSEASISWVGLSLSPGKADLVENLVAALQYGRRLVNAWDRLNAGLLFGQETDVVEYCS